MTGRLLERSRFKAIPGKVGHLAHLLEMRIDSGEFGVGHKFLSTREIVDFYGVSFGTAQKSLGHLVQLGRLVSVRGSGFYIRENAEHDDSLVADHDVRDEAATGVRTAMLVVVSSIRRDGERLFGAYRAALEGACRAEGWDLLVVPNDANEIEAACDGYRVAGCLAYGISSPLAAPLDPSQVIITWTSDWYTPECSLLCVDGDAIAQLAFNHLCDLGHKRMALMRCVSRNGYFRQEDVGFLLGMRKAYAAMGQVWRSEDVIDCNTDDLSGLYQRLRSAGVTAVYCSDWTVAVAMYEQARACGESIGRELSMVVSGGSDIRTTLDPVPSRVYWRFHDFASIVTGAFRAVLDGTPISHRLVIPAFLEIGRSAVPLIRKE